MTDDATKAQSQAAITEAATSERDRYLREGRSAKEQLMSTPAESKPGPGRSTIWTVSMGHNTAHTAVLAFFPPSLSVKAGDRVVFRNHSQVEPHTATFAGGASPPQEAVDPLNARPSGESPRC